MPGIPFPEFVPVAVPIGPLTIPWYGLARSIAEFPRESDAQLGFVLGPYLIGQALSAPLVVLGAYPTVRAWAVTKPQKAPPRDPGF